MISNQSVKAPFVNRSYDYDVVRDAKVSKT